MSMTRKHFNAIADAISDAYNNPDLDDDQRFAIKFAASNVAYAIATSSGNPRFSQHKFIETATSRSENTNE